MVESATAVVAYVVDREAVQGGTVRCNGYGQGRELGEGHASAEGEEWSWSGVYLATDTSNTK